MRRDGRRMVHWQPSAGACPHSSLNRSISEATLVLLVGQYERTMYLVGISRILSSDHARCLSLYLKDGQEVHQN